VKSIVDSDEGTSKKQERSAGFWMLDTQSMVHEVRVLDTSSPSSVEAEVAMKYADEAGTSLEHHGSVAHHRDATCPVLHGDGCLRNLHELVL
jgi:hypothetical protein